MLKLDAGTASNSTLQPVGKVRRFSMKTRSQIIGLIFVVPFLTAFALFFLLPFFNGILRSLMDSRGDYVGLKNYYNVLFERDLIYRQEFFRGLGNTLKFVLMSVPCLIAVPLIIALLINMEPKGYKVFRAILFMPTVFSISSVVLMWRRVLEIESGFLNGIFKMLNLRQIDFLGSQPWAWLSILLVTIWWTMGTNIVILGAGLKNIDKGMYEAAAIDGAGGFRSLISITLPSLVGQLLVVSIMTILASFNLYGQPQLLTSGGPERSTRVLLMVITQYLYDKPHIATSMSLMLGVIMIVISLGQAALMKRRSGR